MAETDGEVRAVDTPGAAEQSGVIEAADTDINAVFLKHMSGYTGATVTIYTAGAGPSGEGMTGVLLRCGKGYVQLLTQMASVPGKRPAMAGAIADIPVEQIVVFVHSAVRNA